MTIEVSPVKDRDGVWLPIQRRSESVADILQTRTHARTKITVTDLKSSKGTTVDGEQIQGQEYVLQGVEHNIKLGRYPHALRCVWVPYCQPGVD